MSRDLFLAILSMDSYNRGYGEGVAGLDTPDFNPDGTPKTIIRIGNATIIRDANDEAGIAEAAGFYAIAYDVSGVRDADGNPLFDTGTVIAYRGSDYQDTDGAILRSNDLWQGWTVGAGFPGGGQAGLALEFYTAVTGQSPYNTPGTVTITGHSLGGALAGLAANDNVAMGRGERGVA
ncbi:MAG: hypothetical protein KAZ17_03060 [Sphingorhabdus sp.]|nr:hypothetical protein [Sphingorhabdus sp.]